MMQHIVEVWHVRASRLASSVCASVWGCTGVWRTLGVPPCGNGPPCTNYVCSQLLTTLISTCVNLVHLVSNLPALPPIFHYGLCVADVMALASISSYKGRSETTAGSGSGLPASLEHTLHGFAEHLPPSWPQQLRSVPSAMPIHYVNGKRSSSKHLASAAKQTSCHRCPAAQSSLSSLSSTAAKGSGRTSEVEKSIQVNNTLPSVDTADVYDSTPGFLRREKFKSAVGRRGYVMNKLTPPQHDRASPPSSCIGKRILGHALL